MSRQHRYTTIPDRGDVEDNRLASMDVEKKVPASDLDEDSQLTKAKAFMAVIGIGYLFPFSALTQPVDYWHLLFPDFNIEFPLTAMFLWTNLIFLFLIVFYGGKQPSFQFRIISGFIGQLVVLIFVPSLSFFSIPSENVYFLLIMSATAAVAAITALLDSVVIGFASLYPPRVLEGLQIGIGLSSLIGSVYRIITKLLFPADDVVLSSLIYFYTGALTIAGCIVSYYILVSLPISKKYLVNSSDNSSDRKKQQALASEKLQRPSQQPSKQADKSSAPSLPLLQHEKMPLKLSQHPPRLSHLTGNGVASSLGSPHRLTKAQLSPPNTPPTLDLVRNSSLVDSNDQRQSFQGSSGGRITAQSPNRSLPQSKTGAVDISNKPKPSPFENHVTQGDNSVVIRLSPSQVREEEESSRATDDSFYTRVLILKKVAFHQSLVLIVYLTSLSMFPALITEIPTYNFPALQESRWWSLLLLLFFCILDTLGRFLTPYRFGMTRDNVHWAVFVRILLFPCLYGCLRGNPAFLRHDVFSIFFTGLVGFTNGHLGSVCIMMVSESVSEEETAIVGGFTGFFLNLGLVLGSTLALIVDKYLLRPNSHSV